MHFETCLSSSLSLGIIFAFGQRTDLRTLHVNMMELALLGQGTLFGQETGHFVFVRQACQHAYLPPPFSITILPASQKHSRV